MFLSANSITLNRSTSQKRHGPSLACKRHRVVCKGPALYCPRHDDANGNLLSGAAQQDEPAARSHFRALAASSMRVAQSLCAKKKSVRLVMRSDLQARMSPSPACNWPINMTAWLSKFSLQYEFKCVMSGVLCETESSQSFMAFANGNACVFNACFSGERGTDGAGGDKGPGELCAGMGPDDWEFPATKMRTASANWFLKTSATSSSVRLGGGF